MGLMKLITKLVKPIKFFDPKKYILEATLCLAGVGVLSFGLTNFNLDRPYVQAVVSVQGISEQIPEYKTPPARYQLNASKWIPQTFNNCGPAATAMLLQHFGINVSQAQTKATLRTGDNDKNIFMYEISHYLKSEHNLDSKIFINGDLEVIKTLIANDIYIMVEDWMNPGEDIGHVLIIRGYDDEKGALIGDDSYLGVGVEYPYEVFDKEQWKPFNREFMPVYRSERESLVKDIIGEAWDEQKMYTAAIATSLNETSKNPNDVYAWFNLGYNYYYLGQYENARTAFEKSKNLGWPPRMLWYLIEPIQNYNKLGMYQKAIEFADISLRGNENYAEVHFEKAIAYRGMGNIEKTKEEIAKTLQYDANFAPALNFKYGN